MSFRGLDLGTGVSNLGDIMAKGYQDQLQLAQQQRQWQNTLGQQDFTNSLRQTQSDYDYPAQTIISPSMAQAVSDPNFVPNQFRQGYDQQNAAPAPKTVLLHGGPAPVIYDNDASAGSSDSDLYPDRLPAGSPSAAPAAPGGQDPAVAQLHALAQPLGLQVNDQNQLVAKGPQGKQILDLYAHLIGASGQAYAAGAHAAAPIYDRKYGAPQRNPNAKDPRMANLNSQASIFQKQLSAAQKELSIASGIGAMVSSDQGAAAKQAAMAKIDAANQGLSAVTSQLGQLSGMPAPRAAPVAAPTAAPAAPKSVVQKQVNRSLNKTKLTYSDGTSAVVDGIQ